MRVMVIAVALAISFALTDSAVRATEDEARLKGLALQFLSERYPNVEPSRFVYQRMTLTNKTQSIVVFTEGRNGAVQYVVCLERDGELTGIERREECAAGILKISPAPFDRLRFDSPVPFVVTNPAPATNNIIIIRPDSVPRQLP